MLGKKEDCAVRKVNRGKKQCERSSDAGGTSANGASRLHEWLVDIQDNLGQALHVAAPAVAESKGT